MIQPNIVCLCGSTRFPEAFREANLRETLAGRIVLSIGCDTKSDADLVASGELPEKAKAKLDELHLKKIDLADEILVLNVGGYLGESTQAEIEHARAMGKRVRWLEPHEGFEQEPFREPKDKLVRRLLKPGDTITHVVCLGVVQEHIFTSEEGVWLCGDPTRDTKRLDFTAGKVYDIHPSSVTHINRVPVESYEFMEAMKRRKQV